MASASSWRGRARRGADAIDFSLAPYCRDGEHIVCGNTSPPPSGGRRPTTKEKKKKRQRGDVGWVHCGASIWIHYDPPFCFLQGAGICGDFLLSFVFRFVFFVRPVSFIFGLVDRRNGPLWSFSILLSYPFVTLFFFCEARMV